MTEREQILEVARDAELCGRWEDAMQLRDDAATTEIDPQSCGECPWHRGQWDGQFLSLDGASAADFTEDDIDEVLGYGDTGEGWDGESAGIVLLKDGRYVAWESNWGPTGSGFSCDAYGGEADIAFAQTAGRALEYLSEKSRELIKWA